MPTKIMVVCPACKAKLKFDPDKISAAGAKFKCPGCASVLSISKTGLQKEMWVVELQDQEKAGEEEVRQEAMAASTEKDAVGVAAKSGPGGDQESDSRQFMRVQFKQKVLVNNQIMVEALDISENGLFLHTGRSFEDGAIVEVGIPTQPGSFDLKVQAMVKHNHRGIGMGLQFVTLDDKQKMRLSKLISELHGTSAMELEGRKKILLVGGTDTARNINKSKLVLDGFYVMQAATSEEVFRFLKNEPPDAMVIDWQEKTFNCKRLLARIKEDPLYDTIIRVVLSALTDSFIQKEILDAGAHRYMAKMATTPAKLSLVLKQLINERDNSM